MCVSRCCHNWIPFSKVEIPDFFRILYLFQYHYRLAACFPLFMIGHCRNQQAWAVSSLLNLLNVLGSEPLNLGSFRHDSLYRFGLMLCEMLRIFVHPSDTAFPFRLGKG